MFGEKSCHIYGQQNRPSGSNCRKISKLVMGDQRTEKYSRRGRSQKNIYFTKWRLVDIHKLGLVKSQHVVFNDKFRLQVQITKEWYNNLELVKVKIQNTVQFSIRSENDFSQEIILSATNNSLKTLRLQVTVWCALWSGGLISPNCFEKLLVKLLLSMVFSSWEFFWLI